MAIGYVDGPSGSTGLGVVRYNDNGTIDTDFGTSGKKFFQFGDNNSEWLSLVIDGSDNLWICGWLNDSHWKQALVKLDSSGNLVGGPYVFDPSSTAADQKFRALAMQSDGKLVAAGWSAGWDPNLPLYERWLVDMTVSRIISSTGALDPSFGTGGLKVVDFGTVVDKAYGVALQSDGKIIVVGQAISGTAYYLAAARLTTSGGLDPGFGNGGVVTVTASSNSDWLQGAAVQSDGKIVLFGHRNNSQVVMRLNSNGTLDTTFGDDGIAGSIGGSSSWGGTIQPDKQILAAGIGSKPTLARLNWDFTPMSYAGSTTTQNTGDVGQGGQAWVVGVEITATGESPAMAATSFTFNTAGSTSVADITQAQLYYTGDSPTFALSTTVGSAVSNPNGSFTVTGSQSLTVGVNYFWLVYTVAGTAPIGEFLDAQCTSLTVAGTPHLPAVTDPSGALHVAGRAATVHNSADIQWAQTGWVIDVQVREDRGLPGTVTSFTFDTSGTTSVADVTQAQLYYTGISSTFSQSTTFGSEVSNPSGSFTVTGSQPLAFGVNHFWLAYTVSGTATPGNVVNAACSSVTLDGIASMPSVSGSTDGRTIVEGAYPELTGYTEYDELITNVTYGSINNTTPFTAPAGYSGYSDFTSMTNVVTQGESQDLSVTIAPYPGEPYSITAWIDWNHDYDFSQPGEKYMVSAFATTTVPYSITVTVPEDAHPGRTRLRVAMQWTAEPPFSGSLGNGGEAEGLFGLGALQ